MGMRSEFPRKFIPISGSQQPPVQQQAVPQNTQGVTTNTNTSDTANTRDVRL